MRQILKHDFFNPSGLNQNFCKASDMEGMSYNVLDFELKTEKRVRV